MQRLFDHEKLEVYRASLAFLVWLEPVLQNLPRSGDYDYDYGALREAV
jgi:hypothetical protein